MTQFGNVSTAVNGSKLAEKSFCKNLSMRIKLVEELTNGCDGFISNVIALELDEQLNNNA